MQPACCPFDVLVFLLYVLLSLQGIEKRRKFMEEQVEEHDEH